MIIDYQLYFERATYYSIGVTESISVPQLKLTVILMVRREYNTCSATHIISRQLHVFVCNYSVECYSYNYSLIALNACDYLY